MHHLGWIVSLVVVGSVLSTDADSVEHSPVLRGSSTSGSSSVRNSAFNYEKKVKKSTHQKADLYFGGRETVGTPVRYPFLCYMLLTKKKEYNILRENIANFENRCEWAITANIAHGLEFNKSELASFASSHKTKMVSIEIVSTRGYMVKTMLWKNITTRLHGEYSHVWFIDADIQFLSSKGIDDIYTDWLCGSVTGFPPLISQPMVSSKGDKQDYAQLNYFSQYGKIPLSTLESAVVENQIVLADMNFLYWLFTEVVEPYFEDIYEYQVTAWGISRTWCGAGNSYISMFTAFRNGSNGRQFPVPLACGVLPHPVQHLHTHGIKKTTQFYNAGNKMAEKIHSRFPHWNLLYKKLSGYPENVLKLVDRIQKQKPDAVNDSINSLAQRPCNLSGSNLDSACCGDRFVVYGSSGGLGAYAWI